MHPLVATATLKITAGRTDLFWEEVADIGTPLVEPVSESVSEVTFLARLPAGAEYLVLSGVTKRPEDGRMARLAGTDICYLTLEIRNDRRVSYTFAADLPLVDPAVDPAARKMLEAHLAHNPPLPDPFSRTKIHLARADSTPFFSVLAMPDAPPQPYADKRPGIARGTLHHHRLTSSSIGGERTVIVYTPPQYERGTRLPVLLAFDGAGYVSRHALHRTLDNLLAERRIEPMLALLVEPVSVATRSQEYGLDPRVIDYMAGELFDWLDTEYGASRNPVHNIAAGCSLGGLTSAFLTLRHPDLFGNCLSQSGSYWAGPGFHEREDYEPGWLIREYEKSPRLAVNFYLDVGTYEHPEFMVTTNRRMRDLLTAKGYRVVYQEFEGGHDHACWRGTLADGLFALAAA
ncbi:MAG: alpha/beta hydrolase [Pseudomonadota bacterium]